MTTVSEFMNAGLVDDLYFVVEPVLFGKGLPMLNGTPDFKLDFQTVKKLNENTIRLHYKIKRSENAR
jgi:dihydrofolate reductase